jgi:hypothetical protein
MWENRKTMTQDGLVVGSFDRETTPRVRKKKRTMKQMKKIWMEKIPLILRHLMCLSESGLPKNEPEEKFSADFGPFFVILW